MIFLPEHRLVLFSPWKTASSTLGLRLRPFDRWPHPRFYHFAPRLNRIVHHHITCADFQLYEEAARGDVRASFVRNPYDRVCSGFLQVQRDFTDQPRMRFESAWVRERVVRQLADNFAQVCAAGFEVNAWIARLREDQVYEAGHNSSLPLHPAHYWTHLGSARHVDVIGRVETFEADFAALMSRCGLTDVENADANVSESADPPGRHGYRYAHLLSRASLDKINTLFARDFELFGYAML